MLFYLKKKLSHWFLEFPRAKQLFPILQTYCFAKKKIATLYIISWKKTVLNRLLKDKNDLLVVVESVSKRKNQSSITNEVFLDVQLRVSQISLMRKFLLCTHCRFALVNLFSPTVNLVPPLPYNWKWCSTTSIPINHSYLSVVYSLYNILKKNSIK
jgi:hypothetical protein